jgi:hypothetical protein
VTESRNNNAVIKTQLQRPPLLDAAREFYRRIVDLNTQESWRVLSSSKNYLVSDHGRVMRIVPGKGTEPGRVLKPGKTKDGYLKVELFNNGAPCSRYVHRLVVEAFIGVIPAGLEVNHISGQKVDNSIENLEVVTHAENTKHAWETGLRSRIMFKVAA